MIDSGYFVRYSRDDERYDVVEIGGLDPFVTDDDGEAGPVPTVVVKEPSFVRRCHERGKGRKGRTGRESRAPSLYAG